MKNVLMVAYLFPPHGGAGVQRTVKFSKYLPSFGWQPHILTSYNYGTTIDASLEKEIPEPAYIHRTGEFSLPKRLPWRLRRWLTNWLLVVDEHVGWWPFAVRRGKQLLQQNSLAMLYSTSFPYSSHLVAQRLHEQSGLPWVADFRDPWINNFNASYATRPHRAICVRLERGVVEKAQAVLSVSEPLREQFVQSYPEIPSDRFICLPNGFDHADFAEFQAPLPDSSTFRLVYTGSFYGQRSSHHLLRGINQVLTQIPRSQFRLSLVGSTGRETSQLVLDYDLEDVVEITGYVAHKTAIQYQRAADALILVISPDVGSEGVLTGKLFEYLAVEKPVLALIPPGAAANLLRDAHVGTIVPPDDVDRIAAAIHTLFTQWQAGQLQVQPNRAVINQYERRHLTQKLAQLFDSLVDTHEQRN